MKNIVKLLMCSAAVMAFNSHGKDITLTAKDSFALKASYYESEISSDRAVLLLHQCNYNRSMYNNIGKQLATKGIHALSLDFRGFGESKNAQFDIDKVQALPQEKRRDAWQKMTKNWSTDVQQAHDYLTNKLSKKATVGILGASCGGSQAIALSKTNETAVIGFFSSGQNEENIETYKEMLAEKPTLIIAAEGDEYTYNSAKTLFSAAKHLQSRFIAYKGNDHGYPLQDKDNQLDEVIVTWFDQQLSD